jgi:hypothetical protein
MITCSLAAAQTVKHQEPTHLPLPLLLFSYAARFPHESSGIKSFYGECWAVFNALNSLEMKSLEEPR